jgi:hypothetical protein
MKGSPIRQARPVQVLILAAAATIALVTPLWLGCAAPAAAQILDVPGWQLAWHNEFEVASVNTQNWQLIDLQHSFNNEKQYYRPEQASIVNGNLRITATNQPLANIGAARERVGLWPRAVRGADRFTHHARHVAGILVVAQERSVAHCRRDRHYGKPRQSAVAH